MTSKQRANLRATGSTITPTCQIGKSEISAAQIADLDAQLEKRELIKITVLRTNPMPVLSVAEILTRELKAETVAVTGGKILLYRKSKNENIKHIEF